MRTAFADTFYWVALAVPGDQHHAQALALERELVGERIVTTDEVLVEFLGFLSKAGGRAREKASALARSILADPGVTAVPQSHESFLAGLALYEARPNKGYSLVDCVSMATMRSLAIEEALTADRHFGQEGFAVLFQ